MHELSIAAAVADTAVAHAAGRKVSVVRLRVGRLRQVVPRSLEFSFGLVTRGTVADGAVLELELVPAVLRCRPCAVAWEIEQAAFRCLACGGSDVEVLSGEELQVESIEVEEVAACTA